MVLPPVDHECSLQKIVTDLADRLAKLEHENAQLKKTLFGARSERSAKMPRVKAGEPPTADDVKAKRRARATAAKDQTPTLRIEHRVPDELRRCSACGRTDLLPMGGGKVTSLWEFVPARFVRNEHVQEVLRCGCGGCIVTAPGAPRVIEGGKYGASFLAHLAVAKCADHLPIYRLEKEFARKGVPIARSTMNELLHRSSALLKPIWSRLLTVVCARPVVLADETRLRILKDATGKPKTGYVWTFGAADEDGDFDVAYQFADSRSGSTPKALLEGTTGVLLVDGYSGYNAIEKVSSRRRAACLAHVRRYFFDALRTAPIAQEALDLITEIYRVEHAAREQQLSEAAHLVFRKRRAGPIRERLKLWLEHQRARQLPKSPIGEAIRYTLGQWDELGVFLTDATVPLDNNASERSLRRIAIGRKNYLFVGDVASGKSLAGLYSLVATCESRGINPFDYLTDVLARVQDHPARAVDELLPGAWAAAT
ncbi:MAG: Mobile element protein [Myxococcaceae bacterium]|nr:Mobile element protein [Myxococcaceae bacterium]